MLSSWYYYIGFIFALSACTGSNHERAESLEVIPLSEHCYQHISYLETKSYGWVACNGMLVTAEDSVLIFDTPANPAATSALLQWVKSNINLPIAGVLFTHFHEDCLGGKSVFDEAGIRSYANQRTCTLLKNEQDKIPSICFGDHRQWVFGKDTIDVRYLGAGHTEDNIVGYHKTDNVLFGGCLIKAKGASKGNLSDARPEEWSNTVSKVANTYPNCSIVVPGHGLVGDTTLFSYTITLFKT